MQPGTASSRPRFPRSAGAWTFVGLLCVMVLLMGALGGWPSMLRDGPLVPRGEGEKAHSWFVDTFPADDSVGAGHRDPDAGTGR